MANPWDWGSSSSQSPLSAPVQMAAPASNVMQATPQQEMQAIAPRAPKQAGPLGNLMQAKSLALGEKAVETGWTAGKTALLSPSASTLGAAESLATAAPLTAAEALTPAAFSIAPAATTLAAPLSAAEALTPAAFSLGSAAPAAGLVAAPGALGTAALGAEAAGAGALGAGALGTGGAAMAAGLTAMAPVALPALGLYAASQAMKGK